VSGRSDALDLAIDATDLPGLIAELFPDSKAKAGTTGVYYASWRGNHNSPALSVSRKGRRWLWSDKADGSGGNAFTFLTGPAEMAPQEAAEYLLERAGLAGAASEGEERPNTFRPIPRSAYEALTGQKSAPMKAMSGRGFTASLLAHYGIVPAADKPDDALIPITNPEGVVLQIKRRIADATKMKYRYEIEGHGGPPWCSVGGRDAQDLYIIEGELNGIIAHAALTQMGEQSFAVMGVSGAQSAIYEGLSHGKHVFIYTDDDKAGREAMDKWSAAAREQGARSVHRLPPQGMDFCDYAGKQGRPALADLIKDLRRSATQVYGAMDRMVGAYSVRDLAESAKRYISGKIINPTGISAIDLETGGIREVGLYGVAALSSMGKSAFMRRILIEHVRTGGTVRVYSPDQSAHAIYRLLASLLSDVGTREVRTKEYPPHVLAMYGTPEAATKAWQDAYGHVIMNLAPRFQISEQASLREISKDMERGVDQGVTMFGVDYLQLLEPDGRDKNDGMAADQMQVLAAKLGKPVVCALQLAKYKFGPDRRSGLPIVTDIEGSGAYIQSMEMIFMVYNEGIYAKKYAGPNTQLLGDPPDQARILLRKDKEGDGDLEFTAAWVDRLVAFRDMRKRRLDQEREGLM